MLTLQRKADEQVFIVLPDDRIIKVKVLKTRNNTVKLGFEGPEDVRIDREEIYNKRRNKGGEQ